MIYFLEFLTSILKLGLDYFQGRTPTYSLAYYYQGHSECVLADLVYTDYKLLESRHHHLMGETSVHNTGAPTSPLTNLLYVHIHVFPDNIICLVLFITVSLGLSRGRGTYRLRQSVTHTERVLIHQ